MNLNNYSYYLSFQKLKKVNQLVYLTFRKNLVFLSCKKGLYQICLKLISILALIRYLKLHLQFLYFCDAFCVDYPSKVSRFEVFYILRKPIFYQAAPEFFALRPRILGQSLNLKILTNSSELTPIESITKIFPAAAWAEREIWDLYGVFFLGNFDLRRILTDYGFQGHPLRKDFPLSGYLEVRYDYSKKRVVYEPIQLAQEFRLFDFASPWAFPK